MSDASGSLPWARFSRRCDPPGVMSDSGLGRGGGALVVVAIPPGVMSDPGAGRPGRGPGRVAIPPGVMSDPQEGARGRAVGEKAGTLEGTRARGGHGRSR